jgi:Tfp pilus assembly protein PilF
MKMSEERSHVSPLMLPLLAGAALMLLGNALLTDAPFIEQLGDRAARAGDHAQAMTHYRRAMKTDPNDASAPCGLALELAATGDLLQAQRTLETNLKRHPGDATTNEQLADLVVRSLGEMAYPTAQKYYEAALLSDPTRVGAGLALSKIYLTKNRVADAYRILVRPLEVHDRNAELHLQMAKIYTQFKQYGWADLEFDKGTARDAGNGEAYDNWGAMLLEAGKVEKAEKMLRRALELRPDDPLYHVHLSQSLREQGRVSEAESELTAALKKDIRHVPVYLEIASTLQKFHDEENAEKYLRICVEVNPTSTEARVALADLLTRAEDPARRNLWEAAALRQACINDASEPTAALLFETAIAWDRVDQPDRSLALIEKALLWGSMHELSPEDMETLRKYRQRYQLALMPPSEGPPTFRSVEGRLVNDAADAPWPDPLQPSIASLLDKPTRLDQPPGPGSLFDPSLYTRGEPKPYQAGYRP